MTKNRVIGKDNALPRQHIEGDLKRFKELTTWHTVVMWRKTFDSLPEKHKPLKNRRNIVLTRDQNWIYDGVEVMHSKQQVMSNIREDENVFIIWWHDIYSLFLPDAFTAYVTIVNEEYEWDTYMPEFEKYFDFVEEERKDTHKYNTYTRLQ